MSCTPSPMAKKSDSPAPKQRQVNEPAAHNDGGKNHFQTQNHDVPLHLIYGSEPPVRTHVILWELSFAKKHKLPIGHISFLGSSFHEDEAGDAAEAGEAGEQSGAGTVFGMLSDKLTKTNKSSKSRKLSKLGGKGKLTTSHKIGKMSKSSKSSKSGKSSKWNRYLQELAVTDLKPPMTNANMMKLAPLLNYNVFEKSSLRVLDLSGGNFDALGLREIHPFFRDNYTLEVLNLGGNERLGDVALNQGLLALATRSAALKEGKGFKGKKLKVLSLDACGISHAGAATISEFMNHCKTLQVLELSNNPLGDVGAGCLAEILLNEEFHLEYLGLNNVGLGDRGVRKLARALSSMPTMSSHPSSDSMSSVSSNSSNSSSNRISTKSLNRTLKTLSLQHNIDITDVGATWLLNAIYNTSSMETVVRSNHNLAFDFKGCKSISPRLMQLGIVLNSLNALSSESGKVKHKVSRYLEDNVGKGIAPMIPSDFLELKMLPYLLAFMGGAKLGLNHIFLTLPLIVCSDH